MLTSLRSSHLPIHLLPIQDDPLPILLQLLNQLAQGSACVHPTFVEGAIWKDLLIFYIISKSSYIVIFDQFDSVLDVFELHDFSNDKASC